ncbi:MAG TPA: aryl-sulfate sulfotransferase [Xanthobacteraceae bacterium]|nr:aryl-sulfate sulfotransferase [Xanthobacteraceae bacterium]
MTMNAGDLPPIRITRCEPHRREPGMILFNVRGDTIAGEGPAHRGWLLAVDQSGNIHCIHRSDRPVQGVRHLPNGNLLVSIVDGLVLEMTFAGAIVRQWYATGRYRDRAPPKNGIPVEAETFHHGVNLGPGGNMLLLSMEIRDYEDWPGSVTDPQAPRERAKVVGDVVMEVAPDGRKVNEWRMLDLLDAYRISYGSRSNYWGVRGYAGTMDWGHANATCYDARDDSILVSMRTQDCIVKLDRKTGHLRWILGAPGNWRAPWADKLLRPDGPPEWQFHQHDCSITPSGTILCFDNGNHRAHPFQPPTRAAQSYSRGVEFAVDEGNMTVRQVWSYGERPSERLYAGFQGGAMRLPQTGNTVITYGGICSIDGRAASGPDRFEPGEAEARDRMGIRAQILEVTPDRQIVLNLRIGGEAGNPRALSVFRSEHVPA